MGEQAARFRRVGSVLTCSKYQVPIDSKCFCIHGESRFRRRWTSMHAYLAEIEMLLCGGWSGTPRALREVVSMVAGFAFKLVIRRTKFQHFGLGHQTPCACNRHPVEVLGEVGLHTGPHR